MITFIRGIIKSITSSFGEFARADVAGRGDDTCREMFEDREIFGHYGFASAPPVDAECLLVRQGQNVYIIASEDRRYKFELNDGEVMLYDEYNNKIYLQDGGKILVKSDNEVTVESEKVKIESGNIELGSGAIKSGVLLEPLPSPTGSDVCPGNGAPCPLAALIRSSVSSNVTAS